MASIAFLGNVLASSAATTVSRLRRGAARPSWSWGFEVVARALKARAARIGKLEWAAQRAAWAAMNAPSPVLKQVTRERIEHAGHPAEWFAPSGGPTNPSVVLYLHGGSFIYGSIETHAESIARLSLATGGRVLATEYRLAPEHPFPAAADDALAAYRALRARGLPASRIVLAGDSAGGNLAITTAMSLRDTADAPAGVVAFSPWVDLSAEGGTLESNASYDYAEPADFRRWAECYLQGSGASVRDARVSPLHGDLSRLPPMFISIGTAEMLLDQVSAFAARARALGSRVELYEHPDGIHNHQVFASIFADCGRVYDVIGEFVRSVTA